MRTLHSTNSRFSILRTHTHESSLFYRNGSNHCSTRSNEKFAWSFSIAFFIGISSTLHLVLSDLDETIETIAECLTLCTRLFDLCEARSREPPRKRLHFANFASDYEFSFILVISPILFYLFSPPVSFFFLSRSPLFLVFSQRQLVALS